MVSWKKVLVPGGTSLMYEEATLGAASVIVWSSSDGVRCSAYFPVGSKAGGPDGKLLVGGMYGTNYGAVTLDEAKTMALDATVAALAELGS